jgi:hypothetical protein
MKVKFLGILIAALLVFGVAAPGHATSYFVSGDLIRVAYDASTGWEEATDLGSLSTLIAAGHFQNLGNGSNAVLLSDLGATSWSQVNVAYFSGNNGAAPTVTNPASYAAVSSTSGGITNAWKAWSTFIGNVNGIENAYQVAAPGASKVILSDIAGLGVISYYNVMDGGSINVTQTATFDNWLGASQTGETNAGVGSSQVTNLFEWTGSSITGNYARQSYSGLNVSQPGVLISRLYTVEGANGLYTVTPVPPSMLLLAPGLLGLFGLRRKIRS